MTLRLKTRGLALAAVLTAPAFALAQSQFQQSFTLDPAAYDGLWYELARTPNDFEDNEPVRSGVTYGPCFDSTATYVIASPSRINLVNACTREAKDGSGKTFEETIEGVGLILPGSQGRKLKIAFGNVLLRLIQRVFTLGGADYWVYGVGPRDDAGQYEWALVSGPARDNIFVLTRTPDVDDGTLSDILALAEAEGLPTERLTFNQRP
jgi:apolipoprotein D and lipocalin family protein